MSSLRPLLASLIVVVTASCDVLGGLGDVALTVPEDTYSLDETIEIQLFNGTGDDIGANPPNLEIERAPAWEFVRGGGFSVEGVPTFGAIEGPTTTVESGELHYFYEIVDEELEAGRYRLTVEAWAPADAEESRTVISNEFTIVR